MASRFETRKQQILAQLETPENEYHDLSPKGSIDEPIRSLIDEINTIDGLVTTSSCSGRISVFLEGRKQDQAQTSQIEDNEDSRAGPGGKGGGGAWLYVSHTPMESSIVSDGDLDTRFGLKRDGNPRSGTPDVSSRYIHLKFEPMILHILSASLDHAQRILSAALTAGFRESGAVGLAYKACEFAPMIAVRSAGYSFDSIIGYQDEKGENIPLVDERYLQTLVHIANDRFRINEERIARFRSALLDAVKDPWEDAKARSQRKREEGLARQQALRAQEAQAASAGAGAAPDDIETNGA